ncbi:iron-sulfur protein [Corynebacterium sp. 13CS0277]|uniref:Rieske (2Fe-2S) protein n=1 Tax=Corynebacterium sp. 13CS0277 TaxID=2071994 RepID=UPI000D037E13|nr:Rieske 2Fe-2S domain-containing protein [Corynebacterium sp. 13CS0277]PRQ11081.1 iron-sulfur protein [Corynebacterium sp. 13CS0277]
MTDAPHTPAQQRSHCSRRTFLVATATTAAGALLAACGGKESAAEQIDATDVPVGSAIIVGDYIVAQPTEGVFHAYSARCPHQGAKVSVVDGATVACPAHGSVFDITDGAPIAGPSRKGLEAADLSNEGSTLTVG